MGQLNNLYVSSSFQGLLKLTDSTQGLTNTLQTVQGGDGSNSPLQMSLTDVNISGSLTVNGQPISIETGSFATTGSNTFIGDQTITGSLYVSSSVQKDVVVEGQLWVSSSLNTATGTTTQPQVNVAGYRSATRRGTSQLSPGRITLFESSSVSGQGQVTISPAAGITIFNQNSIESQIYGQGIGSDNTMTYNEYKGIYNLDGTVDVEQQLEITSSGSLFQDWDNSGFVYSPYMSMAPNNGNSPIPQMLRGLGVTGSIDITGQYLVNGVPVSGGDRNGLITTGSLGQTQSITGSLILGNTTISGSIIGGVLNGGLIKIQTEANRNGAVQFNITSSLPVSSSNIVMGQIGPSTTATGSVVISGSNNILFNGYRGANAGNYGYMTNQNIVSQIPTLNTGSLIRPAVSNNYLNGLLTMNYITSSVGAGNINNNLIYGQVTLNSQSGSVVYNNNYNNTTVTINQNTQNLTDNQTAVSNNTFGGTVVLNAISSSIFATNNITFGTNTFVTSSYFHTGSNNYTETRQNIIGGFNNHIQFGGNPSSNTSRLFTTNILGGINNVVNMDATGSNTNMFASLIYGQSLSVNPKAQIDGMAVLGKYNKTITGSTIFVVGNGTSTGDRRNAIEVTSNNETILSGSLYVTNKINDLKIWTGSANVNSIGIGNNTLQFQSSSSNLGNVAIGNGALSTNVTGSNIVAIGNSALGNSVAGFNLAIGGAALGANTTGENNIAIGQSAFQSNTIGGKNTAIGWNSGVNNLTGSTNTIIGAQALSNNVNGSGNIAIGHYAGYYSTGSNGFYIGNDNYGSLSNEQNKSLMYGEFNNTTANQTLQINAQTNINGTFSVNGSTVGSTVGLITTGSFGGSQSITGSLNMTNGNITVLGAGANLNIQSGSINLNNDGQSSISNPATGRNVMYVDNVYSNFFFGNVPKGQNNRFSGDTNNFILSPTYSDFQTGSKNLIFAVGNTFFNSGSNNIFIGDGQPFGNSVGDSLYIGMNENGNQSIITKRGGGTSFPIQLGFPTQITGSLNVSDGSTITGSLSVSNGITLTGNQFKITDQPITFSSSFAIGTGNDVAINYTQGVGLGIRNGNIQIGREAGQNFLNTPDTTGNFLFGQYGGQSFESGSGNVFLHTGGSSFVSGSNNVLVGRNYSTITGGTNNVILGGYDAPETNISEYMSLGNSVNSFITKRQSEPIRMSESLTITGSLNVTSNAIITGSLTLNGSPVGSKDYGSFQYSTNQNAPNASTADVLFDTTIISSGITLSGTTDFVVTKAGKYKIDFDCSPTGNVGRTLYFWIAVNGSDISYTARKINTTYGLTNTSMSWIISCNANDAIKVVMNCSNSLVVLSSFTAPGGVTGGTTVNITEI